MAAKKKAIQNKVRSAYMQGKIVKGIAGFYYVHVVESGVYECKAKGIFRKERMKPLVGDNVEIEIPGKGILQIYSRGRVSLSALLFLILIRYWLFLRRQGQVHILTFWIVFLL